jgi:hypothetical protein
LLLCNEICFKLQHTLYFMSRAWKVTESSSQLVTAGLGRVPLVGLVVFLQLHDGWKTRQMWTSSPLLIIWFNGGSAIATRVEEEKQGNCGLLALISCYKCSQQQEQELAF